MWSTPSLSDITDVKPVFWNVSTISYDFQLAQTLDWDQDHSMIRTGFLLRIISERLHIPVVHSSMFHHYNHEHRQMDNQDQ